jgi:hypothetical protein
VAITANQHIFWFQVSENQRNISHVSHYSTSEYYNTVPPPQQQQQQQKIPTDA